MSLKTLRFGRLRSYNKNRLGFGGGSQTSTTTSNNAPWSAQQPYLQNLFSSAQNQYQNYTPQYFGAAGTPNAGQSTVAPLNSVETSALSGIANTGMNGSPDLTAANTSTGNILNSNPADNPYYQQMANTVLGSVVPGLESQFTQGNSVNNPAMAYATTQGATNALGNTMFQNYNQGVSNQLGAAGTAQNLYNTGLQGQTAALGAGQAQQTQSQNDLTNQVNMWNYQQQLPYSQINQLSNLITGQYGSTGTGTTSSPQQSLFGSIFSDMRLKDNIKRIGTADNGLAIYSYTFKSDKLQKTHIGFLAQEVMQIHPEAVHQTSSGHLMVRYDLAVLPRNKEAA